MAVTKWNVTDDPRMLRRMGKMLEELGELTNVAARIVIQGIDEVDPGTGRLNRDRLHDEIADVMAQLQVTAQFLDMDADTLNARKHLKIGLMIEWESLYEPDEETQA